MERRVLGKGLEALISPVMIPQENNTGNFTVSTEKVIPNRYQPRIDFRQEKLQELIDSIQEKGIVQPIVVRKNSEQEFELIAGERRLRAAKALGHTEIPAVIRNVSDLEMLELSIIENIQRDDLNPVEEALAYKKMAQEFNFTQEQIAKVVGKSRATVANMLRLLSLPEAIQDALAKSLISLGHAKAILSLAYQEQQIELMDLIITEGFSVRDAEHYVADMEEKTEEEDPEQQSIASTEKDQHIISLEDDLKNLFATKVVIKHGNKKGKIQIEYYSLEDLDRILELMGRKNS